MRREVVVGSEVRKKSAARKRRWLLVEIELRRMKTGCSGPGAWQPECTVNVSMNGHTCIMYAVDTMNVVQSRKVDAGMYF